MDFSDTSKKNDLILQFVEKNVLDAFNLLAATDDSVPSVEVIATIANSFSAGNSASSFSNILTAADNEAEQKLINSFHNNLKLLVEKTWIDFSDATVKEQVLYRLDKLCIALQEKRYSSCYKDFISILSDVVYLMFGSQAKTPDFAEYALRIDPEFGIFWWYVQSLPKNNVWGNEKTRVVIMLGMFFLAKY